VPATCDTHAGASTTGLFIDPNTGCPVHHEDGDLLILVNFNNGGTLGSAGVFEWGPAPPAVGTPGHVDPGGQYNQVVFGSGTNAADCTTISGASSFCATANKVPLLEPFSTANWPYSAKGQTGQGTYGQSAFIEGAVNLANISGAGSCFPSFVAESRSSAGPGTGLGLTAQLKDLVFGRFELCGANIGIAPNAVNEVNHTHTFTVTVNGTNGGVSGGVSGVHPVVTLTGSSGISGTYTGASGLTYPKTVGDITVNSDSCQSSAGTASDGTCTVVFTSAKAGIVTGHATASVVLSGTTFNVSTTDSNSPTGDATKRFVDANIGLSPLEASNEVGHAHTITATVQQNDGLAAGATGGDGTTGYGNAPDGTTVTFSLLNNTAGASFVGGVNTCTTSGGTCTVQINSTTAGSVDIHATTTFSVGGVSLTRATGDTNTGDSANANKVYVDGNIQISPLTANNLINQPHTFTITVQQDDGLPACTPPGCNGADGTTGLGPPPTGTLVNVTLTGTGGNLSGLFYTGLGAGQSPAPPGDYGTAPNAIHVTSDSCRTAGTDASGQCTVVINSAVTGQITAHASVSLTLGPTGTTTTITRATGDKVSTDSPDAVKNYVAGSIKWFKDDNAGNPLGGATFTVCKTKNYNFTTQALDPVTPPVCSDVLDNTGQNGYTGADTNNNPGVFQETGLALGEYTVTEKTAPAGYVADTTVQTVDLLPATVPPSATGPDQTISTHFVNHRPILKISGFGYTNVAVGTPTHGVTNGTVTYTVNLHNYGDADAVLSDSSLAVSTDSGSGTVTCTGGNTQSITGTIAKNGGDSTPFTMTCTYNVSTGEHVNAVLTIDYTTNGLERKASGSPATIQFTVEGD
jgi:hypothetical protein